MLSSAQCAEKMPTMHVHTVPRLMEYEQTWADPDDPVEAGSRQISIRSLDPARPTCPRT